jgi:hypothetical protein
MSKIGTITLTGESKTKYTFNVYPRTDTFKAIGGVYFMTHRREEQDGSGKHTFIYVGETGDLSDRPLNHHRKKCFDNNDANCVLIYAEGDHDRRLEIETDLRRAYDPPCNRE